MIKANTNNGRIELWLITNSPVQGEDTVHVRKPSLVPGHPGGENRRVVHLVELREGDRILSDMVAQFGLAKPEGAAAWLESYRFENVVHQECAKIAARMLRLLAAPAEPTKGSKAVEGIVVDDDLFRVTDQPGSTWVSLQTPLPTGTPVRVTALPKEAE